MCQAQASCRRRAEGVTHVLELFCSPSKLLRLSITCAAPRAALVFVRPAVKLLLGLPKFVLGSLSVVVDGFVLLLKLGIGLLETLNLVLINSADYRCWQSQ